MSFEELPKIASSHVLSAESARALKSVLGLPRFIVRDEVILDYGCDFGIELGIDNEASNFRFQIQLKAQEQGVYVDDGKYLSIEMQPSRLHYLLRGAGKGVVVGYDRENRRLFYGWVDRLVAALDEEGPEWRDQATVRVRLSTTNELTEAAAEVIHTSVIEHCRRQLDRESRPFEFRSAQSETGAGITTTSDPDEMLRLLDEKGLALASSGVHREILDILESLPAARWTQSPHIVLTASLAYFHSGLVLQALHYANRAEAMGSSRYQDEELALLAHIQASARLAVGHLSADAYFQALTELGKRYPSTAVGLQATLEAIQNDLARIRAALFQWAPIQALIDRANAVVRAAEQHLEADEARWGLRLILAEIEFDASAILSAHGAFEMQLAEQLGRPLSLEQRVEGARRAITLMRTAAERTIAIRKAAREKGAREIEARALFTAAESQLKTHQLVELATPKIQALLNTAEGREFLDQLLQYTQAAQAIFAAEGMRLMSFKATRLAASILEVKGELTQRDALLGYLRREAEVLGYHPNAVELATSKVAALKAKTDAEETPWSRALFWLRLSESELRDYARYVLQALELPDNRLAHVEHSAHASKAVAHEQVHHCRHIELLENKAHTRSRDTYYSSDPAQIGRCEKFGYESKIESTDFAAAIDSFKKTYCQGCVGREPLSSSPSA